MNNTLVTRLAALVAAAMLTASAADASVYRFDYESAGDALTAAGAITVDASGEVTGISGTISGLIDETISGMVANPNFSGAALSPDGSFIYDNAFYSSGQPFDVYGLLFTTKGMNGYWNLWGNAPGNFSLWESVGGYYAVQTTGGLTLAAVPEASTWAMLAAGFAGLGYAALRRPRSREAFA
jgi:PEP-CTERM motif-containing protein